MLELTKARFDELYRLHVNRVFATCLRMTGDRTEAEELTQDVFVHIWEKRRQYRDEGSLGGWVHRVAVNLVLNRLRSDRRRRGRLEVVAAESSDASSGPRRPEDRVALERAIADLPERARAVLVLYDIDGYAQLEIAQMMQTSVGTVKAQLHRARRLLREHLDD
jgi:RNA polymerase sigma-70 factor (ECF subfamily)